MRVPRCPPSVPGRALANGLPSGPSRVHVRCIAQSSGGGPRKRSASCGLNSGSVPELFAVDMQVFACISCAAIDADKVFKALADPSRRKLLDVLYKEDGQTLGQLGEHLDMTRQAVTQHLDVLEAANLVATSWRGREKLHFLNPVPLYEIYERWIAKFERPRLKALRDLKRRLEGER